jgi:CRP-like cAMP-binding protein
LRRAITFGVAGAAFCSNQEEKLRQIGGTPGRSRVKARNRVLTAMNEADLRALEPEMHQVRLSSGEVLYEPDYVVDWVWFPNTAVLSVVTPMADGRTVESDTVGYESVAGVLSALGSSTSINRTFVQIPGSAIKVSAAAMRRQANESVELRRLLIRHTQANLAQAHQSVACNALHGVTQRLCRWLLTCQDRTADHVIRLTQQYLATMVGVQRTTVTQALKELASAGLITQGRARIQILDRARLEAMSCECYDVVRTHLKRLVGEAPRRS